MSAVLNGVTSNTNAMNITDYTPMSIMQTFDFISQNAQLNILERLWASYYMFIGNDLFATGLLFFCVHEGLYFGRCLPWYIIDRIPYFRKWKLQPDKIPSDKEQWECFKNVLKSHFFLEAVPIWGFHPICQNLGIEVGVPFPPLMVMLKQIALFFVLEDFWHYTFHRLFHYGFFYKYIHKVHHRYAAPFGFTAEYAHPIEVMSLGFGTVGFPIIYAATIGNLHLITVCTWVALRLFQAVDSHSGYDFPISLHHFLPFWAGAQHHDLHHKYFIGNYASSFRFWDYILDTESGPIAKKDREQRKRRATERALARKAKKAN